MGVLLPALLVVAGVGAGVGAGFVLRPSFAVPGVVESEVIEEGKVEDVSDASETELSYVKINNQFVVPIIKNDRVSALVVLSLSLEVPAAETNAIYDREPKLRDSFLQVLFDHAYMGGFDGVYTASPAMDTLRRSLLLSARKVAGEVVTDVLITDIIRQDI